MAYDRFLIAPLNSGLETNVKPWLIADDAFAMLQNAYNFRGRIRKRFGGRLLQGPNAIDVSVAQLLSRLRIKVGTTNAITGNISGTVPGIIWDIGQLFSIGNQIFTVYQTGAPAAMLITGTATLATYDTTNGNFVINGAATATDVFFYPADPVMGLITYETNNINNETLIAFDTQFAYVYASGWDRLGTGIWTGSNSQFFWGANYRGTQSYDNILFVVNYNPPDGIQYWDGSTWTTLVPVINAAGDTIITSRIVLPFKDRLILLNTIEDIGGTNRLYAQRCRYSQNGDPVDAANAWRQDISGSGSYLDAPTKEAIVSAEYIRDRLIVFFERSTWELVYIGSQVFPFVWQKINTELGAESTFSVVPFDKIVLGIGNVGVHACNGANVERIDSKIPDEVFAIANENQGVQRVYGIRDYKVEMVYWAFPSSDPSYVFPDKILVFNYKTGTWAINDDSITAFGYFQNPNDVTWQSTNLTWEEAQEEWDDGELQALYRNVIAGNQEGFTFIVDPDDSSNCPALQITNISIVANIITLNIINHNLKVGEYILIENAQGVTGLNGLIVPVDALASIDPTDNIEINLAGVSGTYLGGGTVQRVSNIDIRTKEYNFYNEQGSNAYIPKVVFYVDNTHNASTNTAGELTANVYASSAANENLVQQGQLTGALLGTSVLSTGPYALVPFQQLQERFWHVCYFQAEGETVQIQLTFSPAQIMDKGIAESDFEMHAMMIYAMKTNQYF